MHVHLGRIHVLRRMIFHHALLFLSAMVFLYFCFHLSREIIGERNCRFISGHCSAVRLKVVFLLILLKLWDSSSNVSPINVYKTTRARVALFGAIFKGAHGEWKNGNGERRTQNDERGTGNGERRIFKMRNL